MKPTPEDLKNRFAYHTPDAYREYLYINIRSAGEEFAACLTEMCSDSRELALAITKIEEAVMWANAAVARNALA